MRTFAKYKKNLKADQHFVYSYGSRVARIEFSKMQIVVDAFVSVTTSKHINYAAAQFGYVVIKNY